MELPATLSQGSHATCDSTYEALPGRDAPQTRGGSSVTSCACPPITCPRRNVGTDSLVAPGAGGQRAQPSSGHSEHFPVHSANPRGERTVAVVAMEPLHLRPFPLLWRPWEPRQGFQLGSELSDLVPPW